MAHQTISDTNATISSLSGALLELEGELRQAVIFHTSIVACGTCDNVDQLCEREQYHHGMPQLIQACLCLKVLELLKPANMDASMQQLCLDGTRVDLQKLLIGRLSHPSDSLHCEIIWLLRLAGSGKSTLLNSIAKHFRLLHPCGAFVFFDRSDPVNSDPSHVIPTLAYHLAQFSPPFSKHLDVKIRVQKDILCSSLDAQFETLLEEPSKALATVTDHPLVIIVIDGLDECGTEKLRRGLLEIFSKCIQKLPPLFRLLIASRDEKDICATFLDLMLTLNEPSAQMMSLPPAILQNSSSSSWHQSQRILGYLLIGRGPGSSNDSPSVQGASSYGPPRQLGSLKAAFQMDSYGLSLTPRHRMNLLQIWMTSIN